jgi:PAS domain S-box-containing protein
MAYDTVTRRLTELRRGDHLCSISENRDEQLTTMAALVKHGLAAGDCCLYLADDPMVNDLCAALAGVGVDVSNERRRRALALPDVRDLRLRARAFDPEIILDFLHHAVDQALADGFSGLRIVAEMPWVLGSQVGSDPLFDYEIRLSHFLATSRAMAICRYDRRGLPPRLVEGGLRAHPLVLLGDWACSNPYCEPPDLPQGGDAADRVDWMFSHLRQRQEDLAESWRNVESLRVSEERFSRFMEHLPGLAWIKDVEGRYVYANEPAAQAFRTPRTRLYGKTDVEVFPAETAAEFQENDRKVLATGGGILTYETLEHEDGILHSSIVSKFPISGPDGRVAMIGGIAIDITDRRQTEQVLEESERRFRQLAESINEVFWLTDSANTEILYISPAYERIWGRSCVSLYAAPWSFLDSVHPDDEQRVKAAVLERIGRGEPSDQEYRIRRPDGSVRWIRDRGFPIRDVHGRVYRFAGIAEDITERKHAEEALKEADRKKDEFLAILAHELRNPLAPIRHGLELMKLAAGDRSVVEESRHLMERQLHQMVRLIDDLMDVSRITRGKLDLRKEPITLAAAIESALEASRPLIDACGHELSVELPREPLRLEGDLTRLAQVFANLLNNAAKYTEPRGRIWLTAEQHGNVAVVRVRDNGSGIAGEMIPKVFEMFTQVDTSQSRSRGGLGIGLTLVRSLTEMHGGTVEARSDGPAKGSEFLIRLPLLDRMPVAEPPSRPEESPTKPVSRSILVVDDNHDAAATLSKLLRRLGNQVQTAYDGEDAVAAVAALPPDVVLLDIGLPRLDGYEVARRIRQQPGGHGIVLVALTGWGQDNDRRRSLEAGFDHHLVKPVDLDALLELLAGLRTIM